VGKVDFVSVLKGPMASFKDDSCQISLADGETEFTIPKNEVLAVRDMLNTYMKHYGAFDTFGRAVDAPVP